MVAIKREFLSRNGGTSFFNEDGGVRGARKSVKFAVVIDFAFLYHPVKRARSCFAKKKKKHRFIDSKWLDRFDGLETRV